MRGKKSVKVGQWEENRIKKGDSDVWSSSEGKTFVERVWISVEIHNTRKKESVHLIKLFVT